MMGAPTSTASGRLAEYELDERFYDEAVAEPGVPRPHYTRLLDDLEGADLAPLKRTVAADLLSRGVRFGTPGGFTPFEVDLVPRIIPAHEWDGLAAGLAQRVRALNAFMADLYGERRIVAAGRVPARVVEGAQSDPDMAGVEVPGAVYAHVAGLDLVRGADGRFRVLEDNLRTPSGLTYATAARDVLDERLPTHPPDERRSLGGAFDLLAATLRAAAPAGSADDPSIVLLTDGPANSAWYEHASLARRLAVPIVELSDLELTRGRLHAWVAGERRAVDVVYRRTDADCLRDPDGRPTAVAEALLEPCRRGTLACVNAFGAGVADDKLVHAYVEEMVRFYLDEEPLLPSVPTYDLAEPEALERACARLPELVVKPRLGHGGYGVVICGHAQPEDLAEVERRIRAYPEEFIAQETVMISRHPTACFGGLVPRHIDLRPFVFSVGEDVKVLPGGLTRVAFDRGALVVNSSQNGGGKDTWVLW